MSTGVAEVGTLRLLGGRLCLDFANTADPRHSDHRREYLGSYRDLVEWVRHAGMLEEDEGQLLGEAALRPAEATATLELAVMLKRRRTGCFTRSSTTSGSNLVTSKPSGRRTLAR